MKENWKTPDDVSDPEVIERRHRYWQDGKWSSGTTDSSGNVEIRVIYTQLDGTRRGEAPPADRDTVSQHEWLLEITDSDWRATAVMEPGAEVAIGPYVIRVKYIGNVKYVD